MVSANDALRHTSMVSDEAAGRRSKHRPGHKEPEGGQYHHGTTMACLMEQLAAAVTAARKQPMMTR